MFAHPTKRLRRRKQGPDSGPGSGCPTPNRRQRLVLVNRNRILGNKEWLGAGPGWQDFHWRKEMAKAMTKSELLASIAGECELKRKDVSAVLDSLAKNIKKAMGKYGLFVLPGLVKIEKKKIPARPARKNVPNPFKPGETMDVKAKPASTKVKVRALKALKSMV